MKEDYTIQPVEETKMAIFDSAIDLGTDISEICIDMLQSEELIRDIPVFGTVYKIGKIGYSVGQLTFIKKVLVFAQEMQKNDIDRGILKRHKELIHKNQKKYYEELELVVEYLNKQVGCKKAILNARAYYMYLDEQIDYEDLVLLWEVIDQFHLSDEDTLKQLYKNEAFEEGDSYNSFACKRLSNCGLVDYFNGMPAQDYESGMTVYAKITDIGRFFSEKVLCMECTSNNQQESFY